jgi:hypothetical protein
MGLPGDELVPDGETLLTRGITIAAPPDAVWPWLVQMGYGRAGWYSYDRLDMKGSSSDVIRPELQSLAIGDLLPTDPDGGFEVRLLEPNRALVVFIDAALVEAQRGAQAEGISSTETPGLAASGRFLELASPPDFAVSWAFVLQPAGPGDTRLIERTCGRFGAQTGASKALLPLMGFGVFVMMRKQLLGIRERAERASAAYYHQGRCCRASRPDQSSGRGSLGERRRDRIIALLSGRPRTEAVPHVQRESDDDERCGPERDRPGEEVRQEDVRDASAPGAIALRQGRQRTDSSVRHEDP